MKSIREIVQKIKLKIKVFLMFPPVDLLIVLIIILVGFGGFGLGRLSVQDVKKTQVTVERNISQSASVGNTELANSNTGEVLASRNGSKYHFPWCAGAKRIADKNLITFDSIKEAQIAGYTPAANCKGLK